MIKAVLLYGSETWMVTMPIGRKHPSTDVIETYLELKESQI